MSDLVPARLVSLENTKFMEGDQQHASGLSTLADRRVVGDEGATEGGWEVELASQRDVSDHEC